VRVYLNYDGKFRSALQSHQGTAGIEVRWWRRLRCRTRTASMLRRTRKQV